MAASVGCDASTRIRIRRFAQETDLKQVRFLWSEGLLANMKELHYPPSLCEEESVFVESTMEYGDMVDIQTSYQQEGARTCFWVAEEIDSRTNSVQDTNSSTDDCGGSSTNSLLHPRILGCVGLRTTNDPTVADIGRLTVHPHYRSRGIGTMLLSSLEQFAREHSFTMVTATTVSLNVPAVKAYTALGYEEIFRGRKDSKTNEPDFVKMCKYL